ncbi:protein unc-13 homolog 4B-like [Glossina fuscipes fuscipes]
MDPQQIVELGKLLKNNGDKILNSEFALILSGSILRALNDSFTFIVDSLECGDAKNFQVLKTINSKSSAFRDLQLISDSVQKTPQLCMENIHYTYDDTERLGEFRSNLEVERCEITIRNVIENALDTERNQILELLEIVATKLAAPIRRFLAEGAEVLHEESNSMERLMMYLENSLRTLYNTLNEVNFARILDAIWAELSVIMYDLIQSNLDKGRPPAFFQNLRQTLYVMNSCFKTGNMVTSDIEVLTEIERILDLHAFETVDLIHQYYLERLDHQKEINKSEYGQLTRRTNFIETDLKLDI